jgi:signal transduction histidine kinase/CheY-like chemotaxis protein
VDPAIDRLHALVEALDAAYCEIEVLFDGEHAVDYRFLEANASFASQSGMSGVLGRRMSELAPGHEPHWFELYGQVARTGQPARFTRVAAALDRWFDVHAFRVGAPGERRVGVLFRDVTARELDRARAEASEVRARLALAIARLGTFRYEVARDSVTLDERMRAQWGEPADLAELPLAKVIERIHPEDRARVRAAVLAALDPGAPPASRGQYAIDYRIVWPDGSVRWIAVNGLARFDGDGADAHALDLSGTALDITERKRDEAALRASERRLAADLEGARTLQRLSSGLVHEQSAHALYEQVLDAAMQLMGADAASLQLLDAGTGQLRLLGSRNYHAGSTAAWERVAAGDGCACGQALLAGTRVVIADVDAELPPADLEPFRLSGLRAVQSTPLLARDGRMLGMLSTLWREPHAPQDADFRLFDLLARQAADLIERNQTEEALRQSEARLRETDARKDEFLATLAHELRNPLATIRTAVGLLGMAPGQIDAAHVQEMMERQLEHMVRLIDDLMEVSRISRGAIELGTHGLDLRAVVRETVDAARPAMLLAHLDLALSLPPTPLPVRGDRVRLAQVLSNLLGNAIRYTDAGGRIDVRAGVEGGQAFVAVRDSGIGIAAEDLPGVFTMFVQIDKHDARSHGGLGIGLALAQKLARMHGGDIEARSAGRGQGSTFTLRLPLSDAAEHVVAPAGALGGAGAGASAGRVLVVDDNRDAADTTAMAMASFGAEARVAYGGAEALRVLEDWLPDLLLLDLGMPGMDGHQVAARLRASHRYDGLRIIALSGWGQPGDLARTRDGGFDGHLVKPASADALRALLPVTQEARASH